jgi:hypothetical protein
MPLEYTRTGWSIYVADLGESFDLRHQRGHLGSANA